MTINEYLLNLKLLDKRINGKITALGHLKKLKSATTSEETVTKIIALERSINDDIDRLVDLKAEAKAMIDKLPNPIHRAVLEGYYLANQNREQIADMLNFSTRQISRYHADACTQLSRLIALKRS